MLLQIPKEILIEIVSHLNIYTKLNLANTCSMMKYTLYNGALFEELTIPKVNADEVLLFFKNRPQYGWRVKSCFIRSLPSDLSLFAQLLMIFPGLTKLSCNIHFDHVNHAIITESIVALRDNLKQTGGFFSTIAEKAVRENQFKNLTHLTIFNRDEYLQITSNPFYCLKNTPLLSALKVENIVLSTQMLEEIHKNSPGLKHLELRQHGFITSSASLDYYRVPAKNLESFIVSGSNSVSFDNKDLLNYVIEKYPNLKKLKLLFCGEIGHFPIGGLIQHTSEKLDLVTKLIDRVQSLHSETCMFRYIMDHVNLESTNISNFNFTTLCSHPSSMFGSTQACSSIQSLLSLTSISLPIAQYLVLLNSEVILPNMKSLFLCAQASQVFCGRIRKLDLLLKVCPLLETLEIRDSIACISIEDIDRRHYLSLRTLKLTVCEVELRVFRYIRTSLPNINHLKIFTNSKTNWEGFKLPEHDLHTFDVHISANCPKGDWINYYHVITRESRRKFKLSGTMSIITHVKEMNSDEWKKISKKGNAIIKLTSNTLFELKENGIVIF